MGFLQSVSVAELRVEEKRTGGGEDEEVSTVSTMSVGAGTRESSRAGFPAEGTLGYQPKTPPCLACPPSPPAV